MGNNLNQWQFVATVKSVPMYGCESWSLTVKDKKTLDVFWWKDHTWETDIYDNFLA